MTIRINFSEKIEILAWASFAIGITIMLIGVTLPIFHGTILHPGMLINPEEKAIMLLGTGILAFGICMLGFSSKTFTGVIAKGICILLLCISIVTIYLSMSFLLY